MPFPLLPFDPLAIAQHQDASLAIFSGHEGPNIIGQAYAFSYQELCTVAMRHNLPWHQDLLQNVIRGLWHQHNGRPIYVGYDMTSGMIRVLASCRGQQTFSKFDAVMMTHPAYVEQGQAILGISKLRHVAYWDPPCTAIALWPTGLQGETDEPRVVDAANMAAFFSYPESDHDLGVPVDIAGPDYARVPVVEECFFTAGGKNIQYRNRWVPVTDSSPDEDELSEEEIAEKFIEYLQQHYQ